MIILEYQFKKMKRALLSVALIFFTGLYVSRSYGQNVRKAGINKHDRSVNSQWSGKRVAFLGDSMTEKKTGDTSFVYWEYLAALLGVQPYVYGISGNQWDGIYKQAVKLSQEHPNDVDAIIIFAGTNDYNHGVPLGEFYEEITKTTNHNGKEVTRKYREPVITSTTFCGRINTVLSYLKEKFPQQQIVLMTPIHRGYAKFNDKNIQPEESFANGQGLYINDYVHLLKQASENWSIPVIDLFSISGLYPLTFSQSGYFRNKDTDLLHLNQSGNYRLAKTIQYQLLALPSTFNQ